MKIALLGDVSLNGIYDITKSDLVYERLAEVKKQIEDCDIAIANLESPFTRITKTHVCKGAYLRSDPSNAEVLKYLGITHVTVANNHIFDYGEAGAEETLDFLQKAGIQHVGLCKEPELLQIGNDKVLLNGFCCYSANGIRYGNQKGRVQTLTYDVVEDFFQTAKEKKAIPIVSVHFGVEYLHYPSVEHVRLFRKLTEEMPYVLHGNHPHSIQGYESRNDSLLFYALGNLCFGDVDVTSIHQPVKENEETRKNYIAKIDISGNVIQNYDVIALTCSDDGMIHADRNVLAELKKYSDRMMESEKAIEQYRRKEIEKQKESRQKRDVRFFVDRLNRKYVGAFINGMIHARKYRKIMEKFIG